ncbi:MAG TPA: sugar transferase [Bacteroidota bacterium]|nr:sugar transferase [Bacteroidota bacterium]
MRMNGTNRHEVLVLVVTDLITTSIAWTIYYLFRVRSGLFTVSADPEYLVPMVAVSLLWLLFFFVVGLYRPWYAASRFDELALLFKALTVGTFVLFFAVLLDDVGKPTGTNSRLLIAVYWADILVIVSSGRMILRSIQRRMLIAGIGVHNTLIVGSSARSKELFNEVARYPALGYNVVGFIGLDRRRAGTVHRKVPVLGGVDDLPGVIGQRGIREVLIALDSTDHSRLLDIIGKCNGHRVGLKIMPDLYDIISGQARTNQIYGFPLIEITPQLMPAWEESTKRLLDVAVSAAVLVAGLPLWLLIALAIKLESPGPVLYRQERVGRDGVAFDIVKFRSMRNDAEVEGPRWAGRRDPRVTRVGKILRQSHLDEIPQMINVLMGEMSLIGPRPERPVFVQKLSEEIPLYQRRLKVRPGITGWAQVKQKYDETIDDVKKKVQYDLFYIENMSLRMDFKIMLSTAYHVLRGRGR